MADRRFAAGEPKLPSARLAGTPTSRRASYLDWVEHTQDPAADGTEALVAVNLHDGESRPSTTARRRARRRTPARQRDARPARGLKPGIDYLAARDLDDLYLAVESAVQHPQAFAAYACAAAARRSCSAPLGWSPGWCTTCCSRSAAVSAILQRLGRRAPAGRAAAARRRIGAVGPRTGGSTTAATRCSAPAADARCIGSPSGSTATACPAPSSIAASGTAARRS